MSELIRVPDIGNDQGEVIELLVAVGDRIEAEQSLATLESAKASMEIPAPRAGLIKALHIKLGDRLKTGDPLLELETEDTAQPAPEAAAPASAKAQPSDSPEPAPEAPAANSTTAQPTDSVQIIAVPDLGSAGKARVIEVLAQTGDSILPEQSLLTLESDKASMEIPAPQAGVIEQWLVQLDEEVHTGQPMLRLKTLGAASTPSASTSTDNSRPAHTLPANAEPEVAAVVGAIAALSAHAAESAATPPPSHGSRVHAGPAVRRLARELGADLTQVSASGPKGRILKEDLNGYIKQRLQQPLAAPSSTPSSGSGIPSIPVQDFAAFGEIEHIALTRLMQLGAANLHRSWLNLPHVTQFDQADISELESYRLAQKESASKAGVKLTLLPILLKICARLLNEMPEFGSSLSADGQSLIRKHYCHIGFAVDTADGLLVPVIRDVDRKGLFELAREAAELAEQARTKKLPGAAMQGGCFTITSLGHIGGTGFTPIINAPEVAILGVSKASLQPVWDGASFAPRLMLPLSLSYDHRVINGAAAARFTKRLGELLADIRQLLL